MQPRAPTPTNLGVLGDLFAGADCIPNKLGPGHLPHAKKLLALGLIAVRPEGICITDQGREALASASPRRSAQPRGPTDTNLFVLAELFAGGRECVPNKIPQVNYPHARRLLEFGLMEARDGMICLTGAGRDALAARVAARGAHEVVATRSAALDDLDGVMHDAFAWSETGVISPHLRAFMERSGMGAQARADGDAGFMIGEILGAVLGIAEEKWGRMSPEWKSLVLRWHPAPAEEGVEE